MQIGPRDPNAVKLGSYNVDQYAALYPIRAERGDTIVHRGRQFALTYPILIRRKDRASPISHALAVCEDATQGVKLKRTLRKHYVEKPTNAGLYQ